MCQSVGPMRAEWKCSEKRANLKQVGAHAKCQMQPAANYRQGAGFETVCFGSTTWTVLRSRRAPLSKTLFCLADAILDRIIHNAHRLKLTGDSLRKQQAPKTVAA